MYVVRRPFRNLGVMLEPGSVVEPASIKRFKTRLKDRYIVEVTQDNFKSWQEYFKGRHKIDIKEPVVKQEPDAEQNTETAQEPVVKQEPEADKEPVVKHEPDAIKEPVKPAKAVAVAKPK